MLIHSRAVFNKILSDLKNFLFILTTSTQCLYLCYLLYGLAAQIGNLAANIILSVLSALYLAFTITIKFNPGLIKKSDKCKAKHIYAISKLTVKAFTLALTLYGIHIASSNVNSITVVLTALTVIGWTLGVLFEVITFIFEKYIDMVLTAFTTDIPLLKKLIPNDSEQTKNYVKALGEEYAADIRTKKEVKKAEKKALSKAKNAMRIEKIKGFLTKKNKEAPSEIKTEEASKK